MQVDEKMAEPAADVLPECGLTLGLALHTYINTSLDILITSVGNIF